MRTLLHYVHLNHESMKNIIFRSIELDLDFIRIPYLSIAHKVIFIFKKYHLLFKNLIIGFAIGDSFIKLFGYKYYYDDKFGISFLESVYVDNWFLKNYMEKNPTIIDIGANIGQFSFFCKSYLNAKKVYSFEPIHQTFKVLQLNVANAYNYAITDKPLLDMFIPETSLMASNFKTNEYEKKESVPCISLDNIDDLKEEKTIDLLKIDTEGSELDVLKASKDILKKSKYILIELSINRKSASNAVETISFLNEIIPNLKIVKVGRLYYDKNIMTAMDILFLNEI